MSEPRSGDKSEPITIKKYANRRLYNTATSSYVTLDHLCGMVKEGVDFVVYDAKSGEDITRPVLTQIIVEEESKGQNLLPIAFLRQLISLYGDNMQWMVPSYLEHMMTAFSSNQDRMRQTMKETFGGLFPFGNIEEMGKQNMALFENAMKAFTPFTPPVPPSPTGGESEAKREATPEPRGAAAEANDSGGPGGPDALRALQQQVDLLRKQLESLSIRAKRDGQEGNG